MSTRHDDRSISRRTALAGLGAGSLAFAGSRLTSAQGTSSSTTDHPIVGAWDEGGDPENPDDHTFSIFHGNGAYSAIHPIAGPSIGVWKVNEDASVSLTTKALNISFDAGQYLNGTVNGNYTLVVAEDGLTYSGPFNVTLRTGDGTRVAGFDAVANATRLQVEETPPLAKTTG